MTDKDPNNLTGWAAVQGGPPPAEDYRSIKPGDLVTPTRRITEMAIGKDCLCTYEGVGDVSPAFTVTAVDRACPLHGVGAPFDACSPLDADGHPSAVSPQRANDPDLPIGRGPAADLVILDDPHPPVRTAAEQEATRVATEDWWRSTELTRTGLTPDEAAVYASMEATIGQATYQFWVCPMTGHQLVRWDGDVARCLAPDCGRTSADPVVAIVEDEMSAVMAAPLTDAEAAQAQRLAEIGARYQAKRDELAAAGLDQPQPQGGASGAGWFPPSDCTHGADCLVHPDTNAVHNFDEDLRIEDRVGTTGQRIVWLAQVWAAAQDRRTFDNDPTALRLIDAIDDARGSAAAAAAGQPAPPSRPAPAHLAVDTSGRGFDRLPGIESVHGGMVQGAVSVYESSAASGPHLWLRTTEVESSIDRTVHLGAHSALLFADQIVHLAGGHYQLEGDPVIAEATLLAHQAIQTLADLVAAATAADDDDLEDDEEDDDDDEV